MSTSVPASEAAPSVCHPRRRAGCRPELCLKIYDLMLRARVLEERLITMYKQGDGYFWIGGPGEEAFNVPLGLLVDKGRASTTTTCTSTTARARRSSRWAPIRSIRCVR